MLVRGNTGVMGDREEAVPHHPHHPLQTLTVVPHHPIQTLTVRMTAVIIPGMTEIPRTHEVAAGEAGHPVVRTQMITGSLGEMETDGGGGVSLRVM